MNGSGTGTLSKENLKNLCMPYKDDQNYFRPLVCKGDLNNIGIFIVGINPANSISQQEVPLDDYVNMLADYDAFTKQYVALRAEKGKRGTMSRTRMGIDAMVHTLGSITRNSGDSISIAETNVISYPTEDLKQLKELEKGKSDLVQRAKDVFLQVLDLAKPKLIIVHSKNAFTDFVGLVSTRYSLDRDPTGLMESSIERLEDSGVLFSIRLSPSHSCQVMACRHLMYYGRSGNSYEAFIEKIAKVIHKYAER